MILINKIGIISLSGLCSIQYFTPTPEKIYSNSSFEFTFKGVFAKNERVYRLKSKSYQW